MDRNDSETFTPTRQMAGHRFAGTAHTGDSPYTPTALDAYDVSGHASYPPEQAGIAVQRMGISPNIYLSPPLPHDESHGADSAAGSSTSLGRTSPSPLPSLTELRQLHRANSAAGRLIAMRKLMGEAPPSPTSLQRAGSLGSSTMMESSDMSPSKRRRRVGLIDPAEIAGVELGGDDSFSGDGQEDLSPPSPTPHQSFQPSSTLPLLTSHGPPTPSTFPTPATRPRLGRSNTVANGGGEERRSVIGRRMMLRLGGRVAAQVQAQSQSDGADQEGGMTSLKAREGPPVQAVRPNPFALLERRMAAQAQAPSQSPSEGLADADAAPPSAAMGPDPFAVLGTRAQIQQRQQYPQQDTQGDLHVANESGGSIIEAVRFGNAVTTDQADQPRGNVQSDEGVYSLRASQRNLSEPGTDVSSRLAESNRYANDPSTGVSVPYSDTRRISAAEAISLGGAWAPESHFVHSTTSPPHMPSLPKSPQSAAVYLQAPSDQGAQLQRANSGASTTAGGGSLLPSSNEDTLARTASRMTAQSESFEYEAHLRRSLSERRHGAAGGGSSMSQRAGATPVSGYGQSLGADGSVEGHELDQEGMPENLSEMLADTSGERASVRSERRHEAISTGSPVSPRMDDQFKPTPITPGRFADAEDTHYVTQPTLATSSRYPGESESETPIASFGGHGSPVASGTMRTLHTQSPSASSIMSTSTLDPMAKMPFIIPSNGITSSPLGRSYAQERVHMAGSDGGERLSDYPGEAVSDNERGSTQYDPHSGSYGLSESSPGRIRRGRHQEHHGACADIHSAPQRNTDDADLGSPHSNPPWEDEKDIDEAGASKMQKKRSVVMDTVRGALRRNRSGSRDGETVNPSHASSDQEGAERRLSRAVSARSDLDLRHQSLTVSRQDSVNSSVLSSAPSALPAGQISPLPPVEAGDPRLQNSKLYPSPGVPNLVAAPLLQQVSDSIIPSLQDNWNSPSASPSARSSLNQNGSAAVASAMSYYDLAPRGESPVDGASVGKKSWLAEAFFAPTGASFLSRRRPSIPELTHRRPSGPELSSGVPETSHLMDRAVSPASPMTPANKPAYPLPSLLTSSNAQRSPRALAESPTVSTVMEVGEDGQPSFMRPISRSVSQHQSSKSSSVVPFEPGPLETSVMDKLLSPATSHVLHRLDTVLALSVDHPNRPDVLDDPPRRLALSSPVLQVVNGHTVKDRHLFLFSDILVIAKPLCPDASTGSLDGHFSVKSVVGLHQLNIIVSPGEDRGIDTPASSKPHPVVINFINSFKRDPSAAVTYLEQKSQLQDDPVTLASLLFKSAELDKEQLGRYLSESSNASLLRAFVNRFHFVRVRIDEALRTFLLAIRLPTEAVASERLLEAFALGWHRVNASSVAFSPTLTTDLVLATLQLNDALNPNTGFGYFAFANQVIDVRDFVMAFRAKDTQDLVPRKLLEDVYASIRSEKLVQAVKTSEDGTLREVVVSPSRLPSRITHNAWSDPIYVSIPNPDPHFGVKLHGEGLLFDPPYLDFSQSTEESFRIMGSALGVKSMLFSRVGRNAPLYSNLPNTKTFSVERSFMRNTFQVSFTNHAGTKRKYCFSVEDGDIRDEWIHSLGERIAKVEAERLGLSGTHFLPAKARISAEAVAIKVLQDTLIPNEDERSSSAAKRRPPIASTPDRKGSVSARYAMTDVNGDAEESLRPRSRPVLGLSASSRSVAKLPSLNEDEVAPGAKGGHVTPGGTSASLDPLDEPLPAKAQTGKDILLICRQNSLLPVVLGFLHVGAGDGLELPSRPWNGTGMQRTGVHI